MIKIQKNNSVFCVDKEATQKYYEKISLCDCANCRNFYQQIRGLFPELELLLSEFGVDIAKPDEIFWFEEKKEIRYILAYTATGHIETEGKCEINAGEFEIIIDNGYIPNEQTEDYFLITVYDMYLPWVLEEPFHEERLKEKLFSKIRQLLQKKR